jgi:4-hydroxybenzoate polyprenyltransferase
MIAYSLFLKSIVLLDVFAIGSGFVLRVVAGATALQVPISPWLYLCTGLGALFIALSKRRSELASAGESASQQRDTLSMYTLSYLDQLTAIVATSALISYSLYTFTAPNLPDNHTMMLTIPFLTYGLFRYMYLVHTHNQGENPEEIIITDVPMIISIVLWLATGAAILIAFRS